MTEEWRDVVGWEGLYRVSNTGDVRSLDRTVAGKLGSTRVIKAKPVKHDVRKDGYHFVKLMCGNHTQHYYIHRMVLDAFVESQPDGMEACHNDGDRENNAVTNLRWDTRKNNHADKVRHGTQLVGADHHSAKLDDRQVGLIKTLIAGGCQLTKIAGMFGVSVSTVSCIKVGKTWKHIQ